MPKEVLHPSAPLIEQPVVLVGSQGEKVEDENDAERICFWVEVQNHFAQLQRRPVAGPGTHVSHVPEQS